MTASGRSLGAARARVRMRHTGVPRGLAVSVFATAVALALAFSALRQQIIGLRYRAAEIVEEERALDATRTGFEAHLQELRDPHRLAELGRARGFARPEQVIRLDEAGAAP